MADNIKVAVRVRPLLQKESSNGFGMLWRVKDNTITAVDSPTTSENYVFDSVYDHLDTNDELYQDLCSPIIKSAMAGFHGTIFAYGQSGSGKTHTMTGSKMQSGVIDQAVDEIFDIIEQESVKKEFLLRISYMEIYTERIFDLFDDADKTLKIQEDANHQISVVNLSEQIVNSKPILKQWMARGETKRIFAETKANDRSSRSHVILRIIIESRLKGDADAVMVSHLNFVDLAGSEKAADNSGERFREGCAINRSLLTLSQVISKLSEGVSNSYIGYRDSKLTRILQNALGGNSNTLIICTIAPASMDESVSTLRFASRAKTIKNKPMRNEVLSDSALLKKYAIQIKKLQKLVDGTGVHDIKMVKEDLEKKLKEKEIYQKEQDELINKLRNMLVVSATTKIGGDVAKQKKQRRETWCGPKQRKSSVYPDFGLPRKPLLTDSCELSTSIREPVFPRFSALTEEEDVSFVEAPLPLELVNEDDSIFFPPDNTRRSFVTNSRRSGRKSDPERLRKRSEEVEKMKRENMDLQEENKRLGKRVLELESCNKKLDMEMALLKEKLSRVLEEMTLQSMELDKAYALARHEMSLQDLQEFHRLEKEELEDQIEKLIKKKSDLESCMVPADVQYVKQLEQELASNYDKVVDLNKVNKDMETEITKLKKELQLSKGEVDRKLRRNDDYIMMLEKQVNTSQEKLKSYERMSVGAKPAGTQVNGTLEATIDSLMKDKANLETMLQSKTAEVTQISDERNNLRTSLNNKITEVENLSEARRSLTKIFEKQAANADALTEVETQLAKLLKEKMGDAARYEEDKHMLEKKLTEREAELDSSVEKLQSVTADKIHQGELLDEGKSLLEKVITDKNDMEDQLLSAKQELEMMLGENLEIKDKLLDFQRILLDKVSLEEELREKSKEFEALLAEKEDILSKAIKDSMLERSNRMSQSDVVQRSFDADVTVSHLDLSLKMPNMSKSPVSLGNELSGVSQPMSLSDELASVSQPMSHGDELAGVKQPVSLADELAEVTGTKNGEARSTQDQELQTSFDLQNDQSIGLKAQLKSKSEEIGKVVERVESLEKHLISKELELENVTTINSKLEHQLEEKQQELETFSDEMMRLQDLLEEMREERISTEQDMREQKEALEDQKIQTKKLQQELEKKVKDINTHKIDKDIDSAPVDSEQQSKLQSLENEIVEKREILQTAYKEEKEMELKIKELQMSLEEEEIRNGEKESHSLRVRELEESVKSKIKELEEVRKHTEEKESEHLQLLKSLEQKNMGESQVENLVGKVAELEKTIDQQTQQLKHMTMELEKRETVIKELQQSAVNREEDEVTFATKDSVQEITESEEVNLHTEQNAKPQSGEDEDEVSLATKGVDAETVKDGEESISKLADKHAASTILVLEAKVFELEAAVNEKTTQLEHAKTESTEQEKKIKSLQQSVEDSSQRMSDLGASIKSLENNLQEKESDMERLTAEKEKQQDELSGLQKQFQESKDTISDANKTILDDLLKKVEDLESAIEEKDEEITNTGGQLTEFHKKVQMLKKEQEPSSRKTEIKELVEKVESLKSVILQKDSDAEDTKQVLVELSEALEKYKKDIAMNEREITSMQSKIDHLEFCIAEKESESGEGVQAMEDMKTKLDTLCQELAAKQEQINELTGKVSKVENDLDEKELDVEAKSRQIEEMAKEKVELEAKANKAILLEERILEVEEQMNEQETEFENIKEAGMAKINSLTKESLDLQDKVTDLETCLKKKEVELLDITDQAQQIIEGKMQECRLEVQAKESELRALLEKVSALEEAVKDKDNEIERVISEKIKLEAGGEEMVRLVQEQHDLEEKLRVKTSDIVTLMEEKSQIELDLNHKNSELQVLVDFKKKQDAELEEKITEIENLSNEILKLEDVVVEKTQDLELMQEEKTSMDSLLKEKSALLEDLGQKMNEFDHLYQEKSDEVDHCRLEIKTLEKTLAVKDEELREAKQENSAEERFEKEREAMRKIQQTKEDEIARLTCEIEELQSCQVNPSATGVKPEKSDQATTQKSQLMQLFVKLNQSGKSNLTEIIETLEKEGHVHHANKLREQQVKLAIEKLEVDKRINILESDLVKKDKRMARTEKELYKVIEENEEQITLLESIKEEMKQVEKVKIELNLKVHHLRYKMEEEEERHKEREAALEEEIEYKEEIITRLKGNIRRMQPKNDETYIAPPQSEPDIPAAPEVSSRSGLIENYQVSVLEGEKKELQQRTKELRKNVQSLLVEVKELKEENAELKRKSVPVNDKENDPVTPEHIRAEREKDIAPPQSKPDIPTAPEVSSRSGIIDHYKVCVLEGEKKELQQRTKELRKNVQSLLVEVKELKEENAELKRKSVPVNDKENDPVTPKHIRAEREKGNLETSFNLDFLKKRRSLTFEDVRKMTAPFKEDIASALSPIKDSSKVNEMPASSVSSKLGCSQLSQRRSISSENTENCKVQ